MGILNLDSKVCDPMNFHKLSRRACEVIHDSHIKHLQNHIDPHVSYEDIHMINCFRWRNIIIYKIQLDCQFYDIGYIHDTTYSNYMREKGFV